MHLLQNGFLKLFGDAEQVARDIPVLLFQVIIHLGDPMDCHTDPIMDIAVGNALGQLGQFLGALALQLGADTVLGDLFQDPLDIRCGTGVPSSLVIIIALCCAAFRGRQHIAVRQRDAAGLLLGNRLAGTGWELPRQWNTLAFLLRWCRGSGFLLRWGFIFCFAAFCRCAWLAFFFLFFVRIGCQLSCSSAGAGSRRPPAGAGRCAASDWCSFTGALLTAAGQGRKQLLEHTISIALTAAVSRLLRHILAIIHKVLNVRPAADQDDVGSTASVPEVLTDQGCIQVAQQGEDRLDPFICQRGLPILDLSPLHVGEDTLENGHPNVAAFLLLLDHLGHSGQSLKRTLPHDFQICSQNAWVFRNHPLLNVAVLQSIEDFMADKTQCFLALGVSLEHLKILRFGIPVTAVTQRGRLGIPFPALLKSVISLGGEKIGIEDMPQFMGKHAADLLIPFLSALVHGHTGVTGVEPDQTVVSTSRALFLWLPNGADPDPPPIAIAFGLGGSDVLKMGGQGARGKELPVGDGLLLLGDQLLDFFMVHSCQE